MRTANLGFPRIGPNRELKRVIEGVWRGRTGIDEMLETGRNIRLTQWRLQSEAGIDYVPSNDFSLYDHVLDHLVMFGVIPEGYGWTGGQATIDTYFALARGNDDVPALEMTKWFNTNYHYISGILTGEFTLTENRPLAEWRLARDEAGVVTRPVVIGPYTFLKLANNPDEIPLPSLLEALLPQYAQLLAELHDAGVDWVQIDEPGLVQDPPAAEMEAIAAAYEELARGSRPRVMLQTYFDDVAADWDRIMSLPVEGVGLDFVHGPENLDALVERGIPASKIIGIGLVNGRNVWRTDFEAARRTLDVLSGVTDLGTAVLGPSCSLLHLPYSAHAEQALDPSIRRWLAFAEERLHEVALLRAAASGGDAEAGFADNTAAAAAKRADPRSANQAVRERVRDLGPDDDRRSTPASERLASQGRTLGLPPLPTTTIGSFPQTAEVRVARAKHNRGDISDGEYDRFLEDEFRRVIQLQEELGIDVLVHGEFERSDMVDHFAQRLDGMAFIEGWVQSYGTRCVRPPLIYGDVHRPRPMTVDVARRAQEMTSRPVKGMLTGPVTMLMWSFARDDLPRDQIALQLALAIRDEVTDLEAAGIRIIQIDEPAFREGLPLQRGDWAAYLGWATHAFRVASSSVADDTQIHTHMCYSEFNDILPAIAAMDADVISIENSRSAGELLEAFRDYDYGRGIGPGVYDVHSERVPDADEMAEQILGSARVIPPHLLWVNPDCGLKTRRYEEVVPALKAMVDAALRARRELFEVAETEVPLGVSPPR